MSNLTVVNGYYLASDGQWYPVQAAQPVAVRDKGVSTALWVLIAFLTFPIWVWFTPLILVGLAVWGFVAGLQAANRRWGVRGVVAVSVSVWALIVAVLVFGVLGS